MKQSVNVYSVRNKGMIFWLSLALFSILLFTGNGLPAEAGSASLHPATCQDIHMSNPDAQDGNYTILSDGHLITVFCANMSTAPAEYLSLANTGGSYNFSRYAAGGHTWGTNDVITHYTKVRFDPSAVQINPNDRTYSTSNGGWVSYGGLTSMPYGVAQACISPWNAAGTANVDLTGTFLAFAPDQFATKGWNEAGSISYSANHQAVNLVGGGFCGWTSPGGSDGASNAVSAIQLQWQYQPLHLTASALSEDGQGTVTAILKDANGNPAADQTISFTTSLGNLTASSQTDATGTASAHLDLAQYGVAQIEAVSSVGGSYGAISVVHADTTPPVTTDNAPANWKNADVDVTLTAADSGSGVAATYYTLDNGDQQTGTTVHIAAEGVHALTYWSEDKAGNVEAKHTTTIRIDKTAPTLQVVLDKSVLWAPNHKLSPIQATIDSADSLSDLDSVVLTSITSNEADAGLDKGDQPGDIQGADYGTKDTTFLLRAERAGTGSGRVYTITYTAADKAGNISVETVAVAVPHDQR